MKTDKKLFVKILTWAFERQDGFAEQELIDEFEIRVSDSKYRWFLMVFKEGTNDKPPLLKHFADKKGVGYWSLSDKGMSAAIDYIELKEARESSKKAMYIATGSLLVAILVGIAQIIVQICF